MSQLKVQGVALCGPSTAGKSFIAEKLFQRMEQTDQTPFISPAAFPLLGMYMDYMNLNQSSWDELKTKHMSRDIPNTLTQSIQLRTDLEQYSLAIENTMGIKALTDLSCNSWKYIILQTDTLLIVPDVRRDAEARFLRDHNIPIYEILNSGIDKRTYQRYYDTPKTDKTNDLHKRIGQHQIVKTFANINDDETIAEDIVDQIMFDITNK